VISSDTPDDYLKYHPHHYTLQQPGVSLSLWRPMRGMRRIREKRGARVCYRARARALASLGAPIGYPAP